jgi:HSP20 family protein
MNILLRREPLAGFDTLFDQFFGAPAVAGDRAPAPRAIRLDVREKDGAYVVQAEIPGVKKDDIRIEVEGNEVVIGAETRREDETNDAKWLHVERRFGRLERRFALPQEVDESRAEARFTDGVLELTLPKKAQASARKIEVH